MNIYAVYNSRPKGYDICLSMVVYAEDENSARLMHPDRDSIWNGREWVSNDLFKTDNKVINKQWDNPTNVIINYLGVATESVKSKVIMTAWRDG